MLCPSFTHVSFGRPENLRPTTHGDTGRGLPPKTGSMVYGSQLSCQESVYALSNDTRGEWTARIGDGSDGLQFVCTSVERFAGSVLGCTVHQLLSSGLQPQPKGVWPLCFIFLPSSLHTLPVVCMMHFLGLAGWLAATGCTSCTDVGYHVHIPLLSPKTHVLLKQSQTSRLLTHS